MQLTVSELDAKLETKDEKNKISKLERNKIQYVTLNDMTQLGSCARPLEKKLVLPKRNEMAESATKKKPTAVSQRSLSDSRDTDIVSVSQTCFVGQVQIWEINV